MNEENQKKDLTQVLKALESNNAIVPPEEKAKRESFTQEEASKASASLIKPLRTFESDAAEFIEHQNQSLYSIAQAEKEKKAKLQASNVAPTDPDPKKTRNRYVDPEKEEVKKNSLLLILSGVLFLAGGSFLVYFILLKTLLAPAPLAPVVVDIHSLIVSQYEQVIRDPGTQKGDIAKEVANTLTQNQQTSGVVGSIRITRSEKDVTLGDILSDLSSAVPASLLRAFNNDSYMLGMIQEGTSKKPFFIIKVNYYDNAFAGMLDWEQDLKNIWTGVGVGEGATSTFKDAIVKNKDVRVIKDLAGNTVVLYAFYDKETLIITTDENTYADLLSGLKTRTISR